jgi:predicted AlkP superfamily phosphohydrolase/phosphomutase
MKRVVLFGLDGATFTVLDDLVRRGVMPNLGQFMKSGVHGVLSSTVPPLTPIAWTSMVTGRTPGNHGILGFFQYDLNNIASARISNARHLLVETVWSMASRRGKRAACFNFPVHDPAPKINGAVIPGWVAWRWLKRNSHPSDLIDRLKQEIPGFNIKDLGMRFEEEKKAILGFEIEEYDSWIHLHTRRERQWFNILRHHLINEPVELAGVVFDGVDKLQHLLWKFLDPTLEPENPSAEFLRVRELCWNYFRQIDGFLQETVQMAGPEGVVVIASDHGFTRTKEVLYINNWLEKQGYLTWKAGTEVMPEDSRELGQGPLHHLQAFDIAKTRAFAAEASSNGIRISRENLAPGEYESFRKELADALLTRCVDPETGEPLVQRVWFREEVFAGTRMEQAPDLTLTLRDNGFFSVYRSGTILKKRPEAHGTHHPDGVFIANGAAIRKGQSIGAVRLVDITPTILYLLGLPVSALLEGRVIEEALTQEYVAANELHMDMEEPKLELGPEPDLTEEDDPQILQRLKALGYID